MDDFTEIYESRSTTKLENYARLEKIAGGGRFDKIYRAKIRKTGEAVAMKTVNIADDGYRNGFPKYALREIAMMKLLDHPNVVRMIDVVVEELRLHLIYDWMEMDLKKYMDTLPDGQMMDPELIRSYMFQVTSGIIYCHSRRIIHRDLKPRNLLINREGLLKITDFRYGREHSMPYRCYSPDSMSLCYAPPEILFFTRRYTNSMDIWSMGCTFAEMVTRKILFEGDSEINQTKIICEILSTPTEEVWPGVSRLKECRVLRLPFREWKQKQLRKYVKGITQNGYELLSLMLRWDPERRIPAKKMLEHKYFDGFDATKLILPFGDENGEKKVAEEGNEDAMEEATGETKREGEVSRKRKREWEDDMEMDYT